MAVGSSAARPTEGRRSRMQGNTGKDADERREARLAGERQWPEFQFIDINEWREGELLGYFLGAPYDWETLDPDLW